MPKKNKPLLVFFKMTARGIAFTTGTKTPKNFSILGDISQWKPHALAKVQNGALAALYKLIPK